MCRDYYVNEDPAHLEFKKSLQGLIEPDKTVVVDFMNGEF